jgi:phenylacetate-CoA ligase
MIMRYFSDDFSGPHAELKDLQEAKLRRQMAYLFQNSLFYQQKFKACGLELGDIKTLEDLEKIPFTVKDELRESQREHPPLGAHAAVSMDQVIRVHSSSGTTGRPTYVGITRRDWEIWTEILARVLYTHGIRPHHRIVFAMGLSFFVGSSMKDGIERLGATFIPIGTGASSRVIQSTMDLKGDVLFCTPSYANYLAEHCREHFNMEPRELGIKIMSVGGEPGGGLPEVRKKIEQEWGCQVFEAMGNADMAPVLFSECPQGEGMHFIAPDFVICELIDPETGRSIPIEDGAEGELVYTAIDRECCPLVRFRTRDLIRVWTKPCACGMKSFRIRCIGRTDDMLIVRGVNVFPSAVKDVISSFDPYTTGAMRILLKQKPPLVHPPLPIQVEYQGELNESELQDLKRRIEESLRAKLIFTADVQLVPKGTLPRFEMKAKLVEALY